MPTKSVNPANVSAVEFVSGDSGRTYQIARVMKRNKPIVACTCPGFSRWKKCKHSTSVIETGKMPKGDQIELDLLAFNNRLRHNSKPTTNKENNVPKKIIVRKSNKSTGRTYTCGSCGQDGHNARTCSGVATKGVNKVAPTKKPSKRFPHPVGVPVNVKVQGERIMRKQVILTPHPTRDGFVTVKTGGRGRPGVLDMSLIQKVRAL